MNLSVPTASLFSVSLSEGINELKSKYNEIVNHKLKIREIMKKAIKNWMNIKISSSFR
jgi:hypothetical protein